MIHAVGGASAFIGALILGPRIGRFGKNRKVVPIPGHSTALLSLGFFTLWFGFLSFNAMADGGLVGDDYDEAVLPRAVLNTLFAGAGGAIVTLGISKFRFTKVEEKVFGKELKYYTIFGGNWSLVECINGGLAGCVSICCSCGYQNPWGGWVLGFGAG